MRRSDQHAITSLKVPSVVLMENAVAGSLAVLEKHFGSLKSRRVLVLCGKGNNAGDGLGLARHLLIHGASVTCALLHPRNQLSTDAALQAGILKAVSPDSIRTYSSVTANNPDYDIIIDALLGTGAKGHLKTIYANAVGWINTRNAFRVALDIPTGIDADTGVANGVCVHADMTITMGALKPGLLLCTGRVVSGEVHTVHIGVPPELFQRTDTFLLDQAQALQGLPAYNPAQHKYTRGKTVLVAGSAGMTGAGVLCATAALMAGSGLVVWCVPGKTISQKVPPEIILRHTDASPEGGFAKSSLTDVKSALAKARCLGIGPGLQVTGESIAFVHAMLQSSSVPVVLDAGGLSAFAGQMDKLRKYTCPIVLTPHHGEMSELSGIPADQISRDTIGSARECARRSGCIVVLKGAPTVVALPDGTAWINGPGNPGMATGGAGDVLTGVIASMISQNPDDLVGATLTAVWVHSRAADIAATTVTRRSLTPSDIIRKIPKVYAELEAAERVA